MIKKILATGFDEQVCRDAIHALESNIVDEYLEITKPKFVIERLAKHDIAGFEHREGFTYTPDYYGRDWHKRIDLRKIPDFAEFAKRAIQSGKTLLYYDRLYILYDLISKIRVAETMRFNAAEVGVYKGGTSQFIAQTLSERYQENWSLQCFDTFSGHDRRDITVRDASDRNGPSATHQTGFFNNTTLADVQNLLKNWGNVAVFASRIQDVPTSQFHDAYHFVHLDLDLFEPTAYALKVFGQRMAVGGTIVVDDYLVTSCPGVELAINEFLEKYPNYFLVHPLTEQAVLIRLY